MVFAYVARAAQVKMISIDPFISIYGFLQSAHAEDNGFSGGSIWKTAITVDTCVPDGYANNNEVEDYAQNMVILIYALLNKSYKVPTCFQK